jgi:hypothetical protein
MQVRPPFAVAASLEELTLFLGCSEPKNTITLLDSDRDGGTRLLDYDNNDSAY